MYLVFLFCIALEIQIMEGGHGKDCGKGVEGNYEEREDT